MEGTPKAKNIDLLKIFDEKILGELFANLVEGNDEESVQIFAKYANKYADLAIIAFHFYADLFQNTQVSEKKIKGLWILIRSLDDDFTFSLEKPFFGKGISVAPQKSGLNAKRKNPAVEENKEEEATKPSDELAKQYKKSKRFMVAWIFTSKLL